MPLSKEKRYLLDEEPCNARGITDAAREFCGYDGIVIFVSEAVRMLKNAGHKITDNLDKTTW